MTTALKPNPVIFIHGMWIHSTAWQPWLELFENRGYSVSAPGWPGDAPTVAETREHPETMNDVGIAEIVEHYAKLIGEPAVKPILVGHSFGAFTVRVYHQLYPAEVAGVVMVDGSQEDGTATLKLGYARGVALLAPALAGIPVAEYAATLVKKST